jgi:hypothetical protein
MYNNSLISGKYKMYVESFPVLFAAEDFLYQTSAANPDQGMLTREIMWKRCRQM